MIMKVTTVMVIKIKHNKAYDDCGYHKTTGKYNENQDKDKTDGSSKAKCN
jgi:hypothetical protein